MTPVKMEVIYKEKINNVTYVNCLLKRIIFIKDKNT